MTIYTIESQHRQAAVDQFLNTGGPPPEGVQMLGRWHDPGLRRGFTLSEADSAEAVAAWCHQWANWISFEVVPVIDDEALGRVFRS